jgi:hypothetical protein
VGYRPLAFGREKIKRERCNERYFEGKKKLCIARGGKYFLGGEGGRFFLVLAG